MHLPSWAQHDREISQYPIGPLPPKFLHAFTNLAFLNAMVHKAVGVYYKL